MDDIKCLPDDFVGNSKPSKIIEKMYQEGEKIEKDALEKINLKRKDICEKYEKIIEKLSEELKKNLEDVKGFIKNELFESKLRANNDNVMNMEKESFQKIYDNIQNYTSKSHTLVEEFYKKLILLEKEKSNEFKQVLKCTYEEIKKISFKLPSEYDKCIEFEIEKVNQSILCNHRNYMELKNHLLLEIENDCKIFIEELRHVKECWVKYLKKQTDILIKGLKIKNSRNLMDVNPDLPKALNKLKSEMENMNPKLGNIESITRVVQAKEWLRSIRHTLARVDTSAQKLMATFKQAAVLVFNRFFQELRVLANQLSEVMNKDEIESIQCEMYTPALEEISTLYHVELEHIKKIWNELVENLSNTVECCYNFLIAGATLWENHFKRTEVLRLVILKDVDNTIIANNISSDPYESKLNILIDNLRQEPSKEKLNKTMEDVKKLLAAMEELYKAQYQIELGVYKKYKTTQEFKIDILLAEIKRFLVLCPPDLEKDPKIQRGRASMTSELIDPTEGLIPNQMMYCKFQIDAISNWQFGLWEAIGNYVAVAKTELLAETDKWVKKQTSRLDKRLEVRLGIHSLRLDKIWNYIYNIRLEELCIHHTRFEEHKDAIDKRIIELKEECGTHVNQFDQFFENYNKQLIQLENKISQLPNSGMVNANKVILKAETEKCMEDINGLCSEFSQKCSNFFEKVKLSHIQFSKNMKLFYDYGNFSIHEIKEYLKHQSKIEAHVEKSMAGFKKDIETATEKIIVKIEAKQDQILSLLQQAKEEYEFIETIEKKLKDPETELLEEISNFQYEFKSVVQQFERCKMDIIAKCGNYEYFNDFQDILKKFLERLENMGKYLQHPTPIVLYFDKTPFNRPSPSHHRRSEQQDLTLKLFNFEIQEEDNNFLMNLNKILLNHLNDILTTARTFYTVQHHEFYLDESKIPHTLDVIHRKIYEKFLKLQNQCETRWIQDTRAYSDFLNIFLRFVQEYTDVFLEEYTKITLKHFDDFYHDEVQRPLLKNKEEVCNLYSELQKKLKPLHGHPRNRSLLEKLEVEAKTIEMEVREIFEDLTKPLLDILQHRFKATVEQFFALSKSLSDADELPNDLTIINDNLFIQLDEKVQMLKSFVYSIETEEISSLNQDILQHCKSFLNFLEKNPSSRVSVSTRQESPTTTLGLTSAKSTSLMKTPGASAMILSVAEVDAFLADLKEAYDKFCKEFEKENCDDFIENLKKEWNCAVATVLNLYKVKYDQ